MFTYSIDDPTCIISCDLSNVKFHEDETNFTDNVIVTAEELFPIGSKWLNRKLLHSTVKIFAARTGWKCSLGQLYRIQCSCYKKPSDNETKLSSGSINKGCTWLIIMISSKYIDKSRTGLFKSGRNVRVPCFDNNTFVTISDKSCLSHGLDHI